MTNVFERRNSPCEVEEPTQPFSRPEIDRLRQVAAGFEIVPMATASEPESGADDDRPTDPDGPLTVLLVNQDWPEDYGRDVRVSLAAFDHIGHGGAPHGMIGSADSDGVAGEIGVASPPAEVDDLVWLRRDQRRKWATALGWAALLGLIAFGLLRADRRDSDGLADANMAQSSRLAATPDTRPLVTEAEPTLTPGPATPLASPDVTGPQRSASTRPAPPPRRHRGAACVEHRSEAQTMMRVGDWTRLEQLTQLEHCWRRPQDALGLRLRAMFELERYEDCIDLGVSASAKEAEQWVNNCQRALE